MTQQQALGALQTGANVFLTGEPGSGKTHTINRYVEYLRSYGIEPAITASTGIAATHIGGMTVHSWSGIGVRKTLTEQDLDEMSTRERLVSRIERTQVLIIEEISMLDAQTLNSVEAVCRTLKRRSVPWGGMQVVFVGDFFQLPPVSRAGEALSQFSFLSRSWQSANPLVCYLSEQHRQEDKEFLSVLSAIRGGNIAPHVHTALQLRKVVAEAQAGRTRLYAHNVNVDRVNLEKLSALPGDEMLFTMESRGPEALVSGLKRSCLSPQELRLKVGARVMFTKNNFELGFVNGTIGEVKAFGEGGAPVVRTLRGKVITAPVMEWVIADGARTLATIIQFPLRLAWAITVHKSQGMTLDSAVVDLSEAFEYGQGYVALSRVRALAGLFLLRYNTRALEVHPDVLLVDAEFREKSDVAAEAFAKMPASEQALMERNFVSACGGKAGAGQVKKRGKGRKPKAYGKTTYDETFELFKAGNDVRAVAKTRGLTTGTVLSHLEELFMKGKISGDDIGRIVPPHIRKAIPAVSAAFHELKTEKLTPVFEKLGGKYSYEDLRLIRLALSAKVE